MGRARHRVERVAAYAALASLLAGVGALGWLVGHLLTYDALGRAAEHRHHAYMGPLQDGGGLLALLGVLVAASTCLLGRRSSARWFHDHLCTVGRVPWRFAAIVPAAAMVAVELLDGSLRQQSTIVLVLGVLLQAPIGMLVLALVRMLVLALVDLTAPLLRRPLPGFAPVATKVAASAPLPVAAGVMGTGAPRRGPPLAFG